MTETSLYDLLQDMLTLQAEVFTCISEDICHKVLPKLQESKYLETESEEREKRNGEQKYTKGDGGWRRDIMEGVLGINTLFAIIHLAC